MKSGEIVGVQYRDELRSRIPWSTSSGIARCRAESRVLEVVDAKAQTAPDLLHAVGVRNDGLA